MNGFEGGNCAFQPIDRSCSKNLMHFFFHSRFAIHQDKMLEWQNGQASSLRRVTERLMMCKKSFRRHFSYVFLPIKVT